MSVTPAPLLLDKMKGHCADKDSRYFTRRELAKVTGLSDEEAAALIKGWMRTDVLDHEKGSRWYAFKHHVMIASSLGAMAAAGQAASDYLRLRQREDSFVRKILPAMGIPRHLMDGPGQ